MSSPPLGRLRWIASVLVQWLVSSHPWVTVAPALLRVTGPGVEGLRQLLTSVSARAYRSPSTCAPDVHSAPGSCGAFPPYRQTCAVQASYRRLRPAERCSRE